MNALVAIMNHPLLRQVGWTLLHSLWQGALVGVVFFAFRFALRRRSANMRYLAGCLCLVLLGLHAVILMVGGFYTYAKVPLGEWARDWFGFHRNHYDRLGHIAQGFIPAILVRELLMRSARLPRSWWLPVLTVACCLASSALYEFIEWWTALASGPAATDFLGTQGDVWDTQWDMFCAFGGAIGSMALLSRWHDRSMLQSLPDPVF